MEHKAWFHLLPLAWHMRVSLTLPAVLKASFLGRTSFIMPSLPVVLAATMDVMLVTAGEKERMQDELSSLKNRFEQEKEQHKTTLARNSAFAEGVRTEADAELTEAQQATVRLKAEVRRLQNQVNQSEAEVQSLQRRLSQRGRDKRQEKDLQSQLTSAQAEVARLQQTIRESAEARQSQQEKAESQLARTRAQLRAKDAELAALSLRTKQLSDEALNARQLDAHNRDLRQQTWRNYVDIADRRNVLQQPRPRWRDFNAAQRASEKRFAHVLADREQLKVQARNADIEERLRERGIRVPSENDDLSMTPRQYDITWLDMAAELPGRTDTEIEARYLELIDVNHRGTSDNQPRSGPQTSVSRFAATQDRHGAPRSDGVGSANSLVDPMLPDLSRSERPPAYATDVDESSLADAPLFASWDDDDPYMQHVAAQGAMRT
ncbi:uncharacterized protein MONBRDRAFT_9898 [Monosiga brevicollis MX1]|uniref:Uncharacterized protein n=1 Tax=Monosiga brevicollis TaxID=81824 RepID=A9V4K0_MONBE|nr:uncharacterized protein MONBRDRAFT_9898 [Monosiga brevicollis MX1]EDQ87467.1 predicted protein [Monosiga brevicollis MX1]|eukprot:XP_001747727.1 hypothetical protein [Monosiga brevicollis MX1]